MMVRDSYFDRGPDGPRRGICFLGCRLYFCDALISAVSLEFSEHEVFRTSKLGEECGIEPALVLVGPERLYEFERLTPKIERYRPGAKIAYCFDKSEIAGQVFATHERAILQNSISLISVNVRLDVWFSYVRLFLAGETHVPVSILGSREPSSEKSAAQSMQAMSKLTSREIEILSLASRGDQNKAIAANLNISEHTVKLHMHHVIRKLGVRNRTQAAHFFKGLPA